MTSNGSVSRLPAISFLFAVACAHDHALDRRDVGAMKKASPAISPWPGPVADPVAVVSDDSAVVAVVDRVHGVVVQVFAARGVVTIHTASGLLAGGGLVLTGLRSLALAGRGGA